MESSGGSEARPDDTTRPLSLRRGAVHALLQSTGKPKRTGQKLKRRTSLSKLTGGRFGDGKHRRKAKDALKAALRRMSTGSVTVSDSAGQEALSPPLASSPKFQSSTMRATLRPQLRSAKNENIRAMLGKVSESLRAGASPQSAAKGGKETTPNHGDGGRVTQVGTTAFAQVAYSQGALKAQRRGLPVGGRTRIHVWPLLTHPVTLHSLFSVPILPPSLVSKNPVLPLL